MDLGHHPECFDFADNMTVYQTLPNVNVRRDSEFRINIDHLHNDDNTELSTVS